MTEPTQHEIREQVLTAALSIAMAALTAIEAGYQEPKGTAARALGLVDAYLTAP